MSPLATVVGLDVLWGLAWLTGLAAGAQDVHEAAGGAASLRRMPNIATLIVTPIIGAVLAFGAMFGLVQSQTAGPDQNPSEQTPIVYGE